MNISEPVLPADADERIIEKLSQWGCLSNLGFDFQGVDLSTLPDGTKVRDFVFVGRKQARIVQFSLISCAGPVFIFDRDTGKGFTVEDWLVRHESELPELSRRDRYFRITVLTRSSGLQPLLDFLEGLFEGPLKAVLSGEVWEEVPFEKYDYG